MSEDARDRPRPDEIEISLFGPGFGECIVAHFGENRWFIVDSCMNRVSQRAEALTYLEEIGVDLAKSVDLIVCTHWHDDHIRGVASVLSQCPNAKFACSSVLRQTAFLELVVLGAETRGAHGSKVKEIQKVLELIKGRRNRSEPAPLTAASSGLLLLETKSGGLSVKIEALSPSEEDRATMAMVFSDLNQELLTGEFKRAVPSIHPNLGSVVLRVQIGDEVILLGADMEHRPSPNSGWNAIVAGTSGSPASLYKVAHHGSITGHNCNVWSDLLVPNCLSVLTPNQRLARAIPKPEDIDRILALTTKAFATAPSVMPKIRLSQPAEKLFRRKGIKIMQTPSSQGHLRMRKAVGVGTEWVTMTFGRSLQLASG